MSRKKQPGVISLNVIIPSGKWDGKPFTYFLDANRITYYVAEQDRKLEYIFASMKDRMDASIIWKTLTGSAVLGRFLNI